MTSLSAPGRVSSIAGPVVTATNMAGCFMYEVIYVGAARLIGEVIQLKLDTAVIQVYEDTSGLAVGEEVEKTGRLLSVELGPGLLQSIYDGIQRPLETIAEVTHDVYIPKGINVRALDASRAWTWDPRVHVGDLVSVGDILGVVPENRLLDCRVMLPPKPTGILRDASDSVESESLEARKAVVAMAEQESMTALRGMPSIPGGRVIYVAEPSDSLTIDDVVVQLEYGDKVYSYTMSTQHPVRTPRPYIKKLLPDEPLLTGQRVLDGLYPMAIGSTGCIPGAFGCGKTVVSQAISKYSNSDVILYIGCGERGNEMVEVLTDFPEMECEKVIEKTGPDGSVTSEKIKASIMNRTCLVANTSNMPVAAREASIYTGITISEFFRDMGYNTTLLADSTSRWAEALREISGRLGEIPSEGGYPSNLSSKLSQFYERAGKVQCLGSPARVGAISIVGAVSPAAGDLSDAVCVSTLAIVQTFWGLSKELAKRKHFPSVDWLISYSRCTDNIREWYKAQDRDFMANRDEIGRLLQDEVAIKETSQLIGYDSLGDEDKLVLEVCSIIKEGFLQQNSYTPYDRYCPFRKTSAMMANITSFHQLAKAAVDRHEDFGAFKLRHEALLTRLYRMKFLDTNELGVDGVVAELQRLRSDMEREMGQ